MSTNSYITAPYVTFFNNIPCEFKSDSLNAIEKNALNFCKICLSGEKNSLLLTGSGENKNFTAKIREIIKVRRRKNCSNF